MIIDPKFPWKLPRLNSEFPPYPYRMSVAEWKALLTKDKQGDAEAEWEVSGRFEDGCKDRKGKILVKRSARKAAEWLRRAAEHGCVPAQCSFGVLLGNTREALAWLIKSFRAGQSIAASNIAIIHRQNGNSRKAVQWFRRIASGDDDALIQLGVHYYWGKGVRRNPTAAVRCFRKATKGKNICEAGRDDAFFYLGMAYLEGKGVAKSIPTARKLFQRANIDSDHPAAHRALQELVRSLPG